MTEESTPSRLTGLGEALLRFALVCAAVAAGLVLGGVRAVDGYLMLPVPGSELTGGELHVGSRSIFAAAGFAEVSRPTARRVVMRVDF